MSVDQLYQQYSESIRVYLTRFVNNTDAEDLVQEVFIKVASGIDNFRGDSSIKTWIYRIATNTVNDYLKSKSYKTTQKQKLISEEELEKYDISAKVNSSIEDNFDAREMNDCIKEFIYRLPVNYSSILVLIKLEGFKTKDVSNITNLSIGTVKVRLHRAKTRLKKELEAGCIISSNCNGKIECERK